MPLADIVHPKFVPQYSMRAVRCALHLGPDCRSGKLRLGFRFKNSNAEIGVSEAHIFPQFALTGSGGRFFGRSSHFSSVMASHLGTWKSGATSPASQFILMIELSFEGRGSLSYDDHLSGNTSSVLLPNLCPIEVRKDGRAYLAAMFLFKVFPAGAGQLSDVDDLRFDRHRSHSSSAGIGSGRPESIPRDLEGKRERRHTRA